MTDPIKRGGAPTDVGIQPDGPTGPGGPRTEGFRDALSQAEGARGAATPGAVGSAEGASEVGRLAGDVRTGAMSPEQAIEALVERQLRSPMAQALSPAARADLEALLRARLAEDPTLLALGRELSRGR